MHVESLESRRFLSTTLPSNVLGNYATFLTQPATATKAAPKHSSSTKTYDTSVEGTYTGTAHTPFGDIPVTLQVTNVSSKGTTGTLTALGKSFSGTFKGAIQPGKSFSLTKTIYGIKVTFKGKLSADGQTFNGDAEAKVFIKTFKGSLHLDKIGNSSSPTTSTDTTTTTTSNSTDQSEPGITYVNQGDPGPGELM